MRKTLAAAALAASVLAGGIVFAAPASAVGSCSDSFKDQFDVINPGDKPDQTYYIENCADVTNGKVTGHSATSWQMLDLQAIDLGKRFTSFKVTTRLEARSGPTAPDVDKVITSKTCDLTELVNKHYEYGATDRGASTCAAPAATYDKNLWWSTDSTVVYDIEGDGKGPITRQLTGSPLLH